MIFVFSYHFVLSLSFGKIVIVTSAFSIHHKQTSQFHNISSNPNLFISVYSISWASAMPHISAVSTSTCYSVSSLLPPFFSSSCCCMLTCFLTSCCLPQFPHSYYEVQWIFSPEFIQKMSTYCQQWKFWH